MVRKLTIDLQRVNSGPVIACLYSYFHIFIEKSRCRKCGKNMPNTADSLLEMETTAKANDSREIVQWSYELWGSYNPFSEVDHMIIEDAYQANEQHVIIDVGRVDFSHMVYIYEDGNNEVKEYPVQRSISSQFDTRIPRKSKTHLNFPYRASNANRPGAFGDFIWEAYLVGQWRDVPQSILVERTAQGIIEEGKKFGKPREVEWMGKYLLRVKDGTRKEIWYRCVYLYTADTFLYRILNDTLNLGNSKEHEELRKTRLQTLGLFAWFLFDFPQDMNEFEGYVYRRAHLSDEDVSYFEDAAKTGEVLAFPTFTSTSRNRSVAERFHSDVLFIISIARSRETSVDVSTISAFPQEEEQLLMPGFLFKVIRIESGSIRDFSIPFIYLQDCNNQ